jgi:hypothetical protein
MNKMGMEYNEKNGKKSIHFWSVISQQKWNILTDTNNWAELEILLWKKPDKKDISLPLMHIARVVVIGSHLQPNLISGFKPDIGAQLLLVAPH